MGLPEDPSSREARERFNTLPSLRETRLPRRERPRSGAQRRSRRQYCWCSLCPRMARGGRGRELQSCHGVLLIEQHDLLPRLPFSNPLHEGGRGVVGVHVGTTSLGALLHGSSTSPGPRLQVPHDTPTRLWDPALAAAMLWIFYNHVTPGEAEPGTPLGAEVLAAMEPRETAPSSGGEPWETLPEQLHEEPMDPGLVYLLAAHSALSCFASRLLARV